MPRQNGFILVPVIILVVILLVVGIILVKPLDQNKNLSGNLFQTCPQKMVFQHPPVNLDKTQVVVPLGVMTGDHVTPVDHQYFQDFANTEPDIEVYSPSDGTITDIEFMSGTRGDFGTPWQDYRLVIDHGCGISSIFIHIPVLSDKIASHAPKELGHTRVSIPVEAGETIGWYQDNVDYNLVDENINLPGLLIPKHYEREPWKVHVPDTYAYFTQNITDKMIAKSLRNQEPYAGKFDWDIDGKLRGNWFEVGTNYYAGSGDNDYWVSQISISPDYLDHNHIIISLGRYDGQSAQFGVKGNGPDPAEVSKNSGLVKYELVDFEYITIEGKVWDRWNFAKIERAQNYDRVDGVVLIQMLEDRKLRFEAFPGKTAEEITGFTQNSKVYER